MDRIRLFCNPLIVATVLIVTAVLAPATFAQDCATCTTGATTSFGYPNSGGHCGHGAAATAAAHVRGYVDMAKVAYQRNQAWPKPFECWDRQSYFAMWGPMYHRGLENQCTLTDSHFDNTNQLNSAGKQKIASIMRNLSEASRQIYVFQSGDQATADDRVANVEREINDWFGHLGAPAIATTTRPFYGQAGAFAEQINEQFMQGQPAPSIPTGGGGGTGGAAGGGN